MVDFGYAQAFPLPEEPPLEGQPLIDGAPGMSFAAMQQPVDPIVERMHRPVTSPAEVEVRKQGWMQVVQRVSQDPNIMRAIGMFGAAISQPQPNGGNFMSAFSNAAMVGTTAYQYGLEAERNRTRQYEQDQMAKQRHGLSMRQGEAGIESTRAGTALSRAQLPAAEVAARVAVSTEQEAIQKVQLARQEAQQRLENAKREGKIQDLSLAEAEEKRRMLEGIPQHLRTEALLAQIQKPLLEKRVAEANIRQSDAAARASGASAGAAGALAAGRGLDNQLQALRLKDPEKLTPAEKRILEANPVQGAGAVSGEVQRANLLRKALEGSGQGLTPEQINQKIVDAITNKKSDPFGEYVDFREMFPPAKGESDEAHVKRWQRLKGQVTGAGASEPPRTGGPLTPEQKFGQMGAPGTRLNPAKIVDDAGFQALPSGSYFIGPDGKVRQKP